MDEILQLSKSLSKEGYEDVLFLDLEDARKVLTEKRLEIIQTVKEKEIKSIRDLARKLDRKENVVYKDLKLLFEEGIIDFEEESNRKIPTIRHENIWIQPITMNKKKISL